MLLVGRWRHLGGGYTISTKARKELLQDKEGVGRSGQRGEGDKFTIWVLLGEGARSRN